MIYYLIITSLLVSIDSLICGFSLSLYSKNKTLIVLTIAITVLCMCMVANYSIAFFIDKLSEKTASLGGLILMGIGTYNLFKKNNPNPIKSKRFSFKQNLLVGFAVGLDGAMANLSLAMMGINQFFVPLTIAFFHAFAISIGIFLSKCQLAKKLAKIEIISPLILIILGGYKLLGFFI